MALSSAANGTGAADRTQVDRLRGLIQSGQLAAAQDCARHIAAAFPDDAGARYWAGVAWLANGKASLALPHLEFAAQQAPGEPNYLCNLGEARRRLGDTTGAIQALEQALRLAPDYDAARYNLGCALLRQGAAARALRMFQALSRAHPTDAKYLAAAADALREMGRFRRAIKGYRRALKHNPAQALAQANLGALLLQLGRATAALEHCRRAVELAPDDFRTHQNLGRCLVETEALDEAMGAYARAHELAPDSVDLNVAIGDVWRSVGASAEAAFWYAKALAIDAAAPRARAGQAMLLLEAGDTEPAVAVLRELATAHPDQFRILLDLSQALWEDGDTEDAIEVLRKAIALQPESAALHSRIGGILASAGKIDEAVAAHELALSHNPNCVPALAGLAVTQRSRLDGRIVAKMEALLRNPNLRDGARAALHAGLAAYHDSRRTFDQAIVHAREANRCQWAFKSRRGWEYEPADHARHVDAVMSVFTPAFFERTAGFGLPDATPMFIVGMPRSGTTLTEQILASHAQVLGIGERNFAAQALGRVGLAALAGITERQVKTLAAHYLEKLERLKVKLGKPDARYVVDKMPENYANVGWILTLFPNARILHARRDLRDVALSCWMTQFSQIRWACDMGHIAERVREYLRLMAHWERVLPGRLLHHDYEELVAHPEPQMRRLLEWLELPWDPACLEFHQTERIVRTASVSQVRRPIYTASVERWKPYEAELAPLMDVLRAD